MLPRFLSLNFIWIQSGTEDCYKNLLSDCEFLEYWLYDSRTFCTYIDRFGWS